VAQSDKGSTAKWTAGVRFLTEALGIFLFTSAIFVTTLVASYLLGIRESQCDTHRLAFTALTLISAAQYEKMKSNKKRKGKGKFCPCALMEHHDMKAHS
jgi:hypothetical protein